MGYNTNQPSFANIMTTIQIPGVSFSNPMVVTEHRGGRKWDALKYFGTVRNQIMDTASKRSITLRKCKDFCSKFGRSSLALLFQNRNLWAHWWLFFYSSYLKWGQLILIVGAQECRLSEIIVAGTVTRPLWYVLLCTAILFWFPLTCKMLPSSVSCVGRKSLRNNGEITIIAHEIQENLPSKIIDNIGNVREKYITSKPQYYRFTMTASGFEGKHFFNKAGISSSVLCFSFDGHNNSWPSTQIHLLYCSRLNMRMKRRRKHPAFGYQFSSRRSSKQHIKLNGRASLCLH